MTRASYLRYSGHLGAILFNIGIVGVLFAASFVFLPILWLIAAAILLVIVIYGTALTGGIIWASEGFRGFASTYFNAVFSDQLSVFIDAFNSYSTLIFSLTAVVLALSTLFLFLDRKSRKSKSRLVAIIIFAVIFVILIICFIAGFSTGGA